MIKDIYAEGIASGWKTYDGSRLSADLNLEADVVIIGSGAGGGTSAEILSNAGLQVVILEEGPLKTSSDFRMREAEAYPELYQESAARKTKDKGIQILQGRCVGGSTTVNWTSSFRTPDTVLNWWAAKHGIKGHDAASMQPWFKKMEARLGIAPWDVAPNRNNHLLAAGAEKLGIHSAVIRRNVKGCWNLGYCGLGCPTNAKQSMLVSTIPAALTKGAILVSRCRADGFEMQGERVTVVQARAMDARGVQTAAYKVRVKARHVVLAAGAIGSPAVLLRAGVPDPYKLTGKRTFLHPTVVSGAFMADKVEGWSGAPQSIYSDHFLDTQPIDGSIGFKLEAPPLHPLLTATTLVGHGQAHAEAMVRMPHLHVLLALLRDGFNARSQGGSVYLNGDGTPALDYPISDYVWDGARRALLAMAEIQFAAGATQVQPTHEDAQLYSSWTEAKKAIADLPMKLLRTRVVSAHVMGGCAMSDDQGQGVVNSEGRHHQVENLHVFDGSLFPTSLGVNPQLSIYGLTAKLATRLADALVQSVKTG